MAVGLGVFMLLGAPLLIASFFAFEILDWASQRGFNISVMGDPGGTLRILGGVFSVIGLLIVLVGLPLRKKG